MVTALCICVVHLCVRMQGRGCGGSEVGEKKVDLLLRRCPSGFVCVCHEWL